MSRSSLVWISLICLMLFPCLASADLVNPGFETGDLTGWTYEDGGGSQDAAFVVTDFTGQTLTYTPPAGSYFLRLRGWFTVAAYQDVSLSTGQELNGWAALDNDAAGGDEIPYGQVQIQDVSAGTWDYPWSVGQNDVAFGTSGAWTPWTWTAPHDGTYRVRYYADAITTDNLENALFDMEIGEAPPVPEPGTLALLAMGLPGLVYFRRRRK